MDVSSICRTLMSLETKEPEILSSLKKLKGILSRGDSKMNLRNTFLREGGLKSIIGLCRCSEDYSVLLLSLDCLNLAISGCDELRYRALEMGVVRIVLCFLKQDKFKEETRCRYMALQETLMSLLRKLTCNHRQLSHAPLLDSISVVFKILKEQYSSTIETYPLNTRQRLSELTVGECFIAAVNRVPSVVKTRVCQLFPTLIALGEAFVQQYPLFYVDLNDSSGRYVTDILVDEGLAEADSNYSLMSSKDCTPSWVILRVFHVSGPVQIWAEFSIDRKSNEQLELFTEFHNAPPQSSLAPPTSLTLGSVYSVYNSIPTDVAAVGWYRGWLIHCPADDDSYDQHYVLFCMDYGYTVTVLKDSIRQLPSQFKGLPPRVAPCVLAGIGPPVRSVQLLNDCTGIFRNLSFNGEQYWMEMLAQRVVPFILDMISNKRITKVALEHCMISLMNLSQLNDVATLLCNLGAIRTFTDMLVNCSQDLDVPVQVCLVHCLIMLSSVNNKMFKLIKVSDQLKEWVCATRRDLMVMKHVERLLNIIEQEEHKRNVSASDGSLTSAIVRTNNMSPTAYSNTDNMVVPKRMKKSVGPLSLANGEKSPVYRLQSQETHATGHITEDMINHLPAIAVAPVEYGSHLPATPKYAYEYINVDVLTEVSRSRILRSLCGLANVETEGVLYIGALEDGRVKGIGLSRTQRNDVRLDVDHLVTQLNPPIISSRYRIEFIPVAESPCRTDQFVISIKISPSNSKTIHVFKRNDHSKEECYIHKNGKSIKMGIQDVREMVAEQLLKSMVL